MFNLLVSYQCIFNQLINFFRRRLSWCSLWCVGCPSTQSTASKHSALGVKYQPGSWIRLLSCRMWIRRWIRFCMRTTWRISGRHWRRGSFVGLVKKGIAPSGRSREVWRWKDCLLQLWHRWRRRWPMGRRLRIWTEVCLFPLHCVNLFDQIWRGIFEVDLCSMYHSLVFLKMPSKVFVDETSTYLIQEWLIWAFRNVQHLVPCLLGISFCIHTWRTSTRIWSIVSSVILVSNRIFPVVLKMEALSSSALMQMTSKIFDGKKFLNFSWEVGQWLPLHFFLTYFNRL